MDQIKFNILIKIQFPNFHLTVASTFTEHIEFCKRCHIHMTVYILNQMAHDVGYIKNDII